MLKIKLKLVNLLLLLLLVETVIVSGINESDDLSDFEFDNLDSPPSDDYYYNDDVIPHGFEKPKDPLLTDIGSSSFDSKEQRLKKILVKAWSNGEMRRNFAEVLPILRVMSTTQRVALAALISTQATAKQGKELTLKQVREMFGDRPDLILPLALDIANLVRLAGTNVEQKLMQSYKEKESIPSEQLLRRSFGMKQETKGALHSPEISVQSAYMKDDQLHVDEDVVPKMKTKDLSDVSKIRSSKKEPENVDQVKIENENHHSRQKRSYHEKKLNMTNFNGTGDQLAMATDEIEQLSSYADIIPTYIKHNLTLEQIEDLAFSSLNGTDYEEMDVNSTSDENLPTPEMLIGGYYRPKIIKLNHYHRKIYPNQNTDRLGACEKFGNLCLRVTDYPMDQIMGSIRRNRHAMTALLAEYRDNNVIIEKVKNDELRNNLRRRGDDLSAPGGMCPSIVRYARPQKARSATGEWKYIVNTGHHTQTLRLEKCSNPQDSCTYLTDNFRSRCTQVFNYHRLLSWDKVRGLHVDIFKVPTCCSCQIDGYKEAFPPLYNKPDYSDTSIKKTKYTAVDDDGDDDDDEEDNNSNANSYYSTGFKFQNQKPFNLDSSPILLQSSSINKIRVERPKIAKVHSAISQASPGLDSYLSPPSNKYDTATTFKRQTPTQTKRKRPARRDQSVSGSEIQPQTILPNTQNLQNIQNIQNIQNLQKLQNLQNLPKLPKLQSKIDITTNRPIRITTTSRDTKKVNVKLPNMSSSSSIPNHAGNLDPSKRINYNYHPIIDFFEDEDEEDDIVSDREIGDRMGVRIPENKWKPLLNRRMRPS